MTRITETTLTASLTTCKSNIGLINTSTTSLDDVDFTHTSHTNSLTMNTTTIPNEMEFEHVDSLTISLITTLSDITDIYSLTISLTTTLTTNNMEEYELNAVMTTGDVQIPPEKKILKCLQLQIQHQHLLQ